MLAMGIVTLAPAPTALFQTASMLGCEMCSVTGLLVYFLPSKTSARKTTESPIEMAACMSLPPGTGWREMTVAPKAVPYHLMAFSAPSMDKYGVTVRGTTPAGAASGLRAGGVSVPGAHLLGVLR